MKKSYSRNALWYGALIFFVVALTGCESCTPDTRNFALLGQWDVPGGETYTVVEDIPIDQTVDFIGRVYYSSADSLAIEELGATQDYDPNGISVLPGKHPLVVFGHGQYSAGYPTNYLGMSKLMEHLASWGYICISVNLDVLQGGWSAYDSGIPQRGELMLHAIEFMLEQNADDGSIFYDKIDVDKIALIGHSRGGGGAISAVTQNLAKPSPRPILALATISPVDFGVDPLAGPVPHLSFYGSWDGDLKRGNGPRIWSAGARLADRLFVEVHGGNHFHFTDVIDYNKETEDILREEHWEISEGFINAFFDKHVRNLDRYTWPEYLTGAKRINNVDYFLQYQTSDFETIDDGSPLGTPDTNNMIGPNDGSSLVLYEDKMLNDFNDHFYNESEGLVAHWDAANDSLVFEFPVFDASDFTHISFRVSQRPDIALNTLDTRKNFSVLASDGSATGTVQIKDYMGGLQYPDFSQSIQDYHPTLGAYQYKSIPRTYRIPLADFAGVDFSTASKVSFVFDQINEPNFDNTSGAIAIDDLEFTK